MANSKISALTSATTPLAGTETLPVVQSSATKKVSVSDLTAGRAVSALSYTADNTGYATPVANFQSGDQAGARVAVINSGPGGQTYHLVTGNPGISNSGFALYDSTNSATRFYVGSSSGDFTLNTGNFIPGTAAKGINFTANTGAAGKTSSLLNWYEEGTWTPAMTFSTSQGDLSYGIQTGRYTRIGRSVVLHCSVRVTETTASGNITITGLPFTSSSALATATACYVDNVSGVSGTVVAQLNGASSTITLFYTGTGSATQLSNTNTGTNSTFQFVLNYLV